MEGKEVRFGVGGEWGATYQLEATFMAPGQIWSRLLKVRVVA
jgi:hypothetical protein